MTQNNPADGQGMTVNFDPTVRVIEAKLTADIESLRAILAPSSSISAIRDFAHQNRLLAEIQAGVRAIDVLTGRTNLTGHPVASHAGLAAVERAPLPGAGHDKDAVEMAKKLAPKTASN